MSLCVAADAAHALDDAKAWPTGILDWRVSPVDLSFLNENERPAGRRGFVRAVGDRLEFEDGTPARFWGTNLTAWALFGTSDAAIKQQARRLSQLGFNLVRLHHHDSIWVAPNVLGDQNAPDTRNLDPAMLAKLDAWIAALKEEGIYVWLDLHVGRHLRRGDDIPAFDEISKGKPAADLRGYNYVNERIQAAMQQFNAAYVNRVNLLTGVAYKDEPAVMGMLVTNENDLTNHFGNALLPNQNVPWHSAIYMREADRFAAATGLSKEATWRAWEHGPSKIFLNDLEHRFHAAMLHQLRDLGVRVPIAATSQWGNNPVSSLPALTVGGVIDGHAYGGAAELEKNPLQSPTFVHWLAAGQVAGKPYTVTEWNVDAFPAPDRHAAPLYMAASAAHQGWAAAMHYAYAQVPLDAAHGPSPWHAFNDPSMIATLPAAALLFRRGDVRQATTTYVFAPTREVLFNKSVSPHNSIALRTTVETGRLVVAMPPTPELPWLAASAIPAGAQVISDPDRPALARDATGSVSDTGELRRNWKAGIYTIESARTQAATGRIGGTVVTLRDVEIRIKTHRASVAVQSLTAHVLGDSPAVLISLGATSEPVAADRLPYRSEPVEGELSIRAPAGLRLFANPNVSSQRREIPTNYRGGWYRIRLDPTLGTYWLTLERST